MILRRPVPPPLRAETRLRMAADAFRPLRLVAGIRFDRLHLPMRPKPFGIDHDPFEEFRQPLLRPVEDLRCAELAPSK